MKLATSRTRWKTVSQGKSVILFEKQQQKKETQAASSTHNMTAFLYQLYFFFIQENYSMPRIHSSMNKLIKVTDGLQILYKDLCLSAASCKSLGICLLNHNQDGFLTIRNSEKYVQRHNLLLRKREKKIV